MIKRIKAVSVIFLLAFIFLICKVFYLSFFNYVGKNAVLNKNTLYVETDASRNRIADRNFNFITDVDKEEYIAVFSTQNHKLDFYLSDIASKLTNVSKYEIYNKLFFNRIVELKLKDNADISAVEENENIIVYEKTKRYLSDSPACSLIGYLSESNGVSGVEKFYNDYLKKDDVNTINRFYDATSSPRGEVYRVNSQNNKILQLTLDLDYQRICEKAFSKFNEPGGAVLLDVATFDILAMASYPKFDQNNIVKSLNDKNCSFQNKCLMSYDMGSVFKIVVTAAALESQSFDTEQKYECNGKILVSSDYFDCHDEYGHGVQTLNDAFKNSCNCAYITIGQNIGYKAITDMAKKFGFGSKSMYPFSFPQSVNSLPDENNYYLSDLANLSIGQGSLSGTILQGAVLSAVIANDGIYRYPCFALNLKDGEKQTRLNSDYSERIISSKTASIIKNMMLGTCESGTGTTANPDFGGAGGKTGSAQTGWYKDGELMQHAWFTGFFPSENPKFALCVFIENGKSGSKTAAPVFKYIASNILKSE